MRKPFEPLTSLEFPLISLVEANAAIAQDCAEHERLQKDYRLEHQRADKITQERDEARAQLAEAVEMLRFYAMKENWGTTYKLRGCGCCTDEIEPLVFHDNGTKARAFLEKLEGP